MTALILAIFLLMASPCLALTDAIQAVVATGTAAGGSLTYVYSGDHVISGGTAAGGSYSQGSVVTLGIPVTAKSIGVYIEGLGTGTACKIALYQLSDDTVVTGASGTKASIGIGWNDITIPNTSLAATDYFVFCKCDTDDVATGKDGTSTGYYATDTYASFPTSPLNSPAGSSNKYATRVGY